MSLLGVGLVSLWMIRMLPPETAACLECEVEPDLSNLIAFAGPPGQLRTQAGASLRPLLTPLTSPVPLPLNVELFRV